MKSLLILAFLASAAAQSTNYSFCTTPDGNQGMCVGIRSCVPLYALLRRLKDDRNENAVNFLKSSQCGRDKSGPTVCCPFSGEVNFNRNLFSTSDPVSDEISTETAQIPAQNYTTDMPSLDECGVTGDSKNRIVNGVASVLGAWPWMAVLGFKSRLTDEILWECGGTLITNRHVVTAAHCVKHPGITLELVRLGELNLDPMSEDGATPVDIRVSKAIIHSGYTAAGSHPDDIAIIVLERSVAFTKLIKPICLPLDDSLRNANFEGKFPFIAGWGALRYKGPKPYALREAQVLVVSNDKCADSYRQFQEIDITSRQICAGGNGKDTCQGDSGGPLMFPKDGHYYLIGIVSSGYHCAEEGFPGVYTRVTKYVDWIVDNIRQQNPAQLSDPRQLVVS
ncbi:serine protease [Nesidiocoris tenuis]|uniref:CLIP domain-containing serine protease n=1 Tax=Nesidiocoris tenuis TaxID=355587 RepID=A0ABN7B6W3_9HEMI|nr:serine protease [Nesidiocoris tenuis]